jgi:acetoin utilization deacetylase AcuC-like enzyme
MTRTRTFQVWMKVVYSDAHLRHVPQAELHGGLMVPPFENPTRVEYVLQRLRDVGWGDWIAPDPWSPEPVLRVHDADFLAFLEHAWEEWTGAGFAGEIIPGNFPARRMRQRCPRFIDGKVGYYALATETAITSGTWEAAQASCASAQTAQQWVARGERAAFALCRPPGHHAARDLYGGYCFLNNAAVAAQQFLDQGASRVAVLDIDFHHGNGTQDIFYERPEVLFASLHGRPEDSFPYFSGYADETGAGLGSGTTFNYPLAPGTAYPRWAEALTQALGEVQRFGAEALVISLGVDTFKEDPISSFRLESKDYLECGKRLAQAKLPTVFVMEGGYAVEAVGVNVVNVLEGFEQAT